MSNKKKIDHICDQLRTRICSGQLQGGDILVEETLGREFSLSRTPIRQVLHRLALEHFVETRSGVGTIVIKEDRTDFSSDVEVCRDLLEVAQKRAVRELSDDDLIVLISLRGLVDKKDKSSQDVWQYFYQATRVIASHLGHDLISETFILLSSRIFRRLTISLKSRQEALVWYVRNEYAALERAKVGGDLLNARSTLLKSIQNVEFGAVP